LGICEAALDLAADPAFGLHWTERLSVNTFAPVTYLITNAVTLGDGFAALTHYSRLLSEASQIELQHHGDRVRVRCKLPVGVSERLQRVVAELALLSFIRIVRCFVPSFRPQRVCFEYTAPAYRLEYTRIFENAEQFEQPFTGIELDRALLDARASFRDASVHDAVRELAEQRMSALDRPQPYAARVRELLLQRARIGGPAMVEVAAQLGLSVHALRRRLAAEGTAFNSIENDAFAELAKRLLLDQQRTIQEAAFELGFSGTATFHRAFKRALGMTPGSYVDTQLGLRRD
jgi:AraC-like DNA-binding protein